jgi:hypothetical protein
MQCTTAFYEIPAGIAGIMKMIYVFGAVGARIKKNRCVIYKPSAAGVSDFTAAQSGSVIMTDESTEAFEVQGTEPPGADIVAPIVLSLGKQKKKHIRRLKRGRGKLMDEVVDVIEQVHDHLGEDADDKIIVPVVVLYRQKRKRAMRGLF